MAEQPLRLSKTLLSIFLVLSLSKAAHSICFGLRTSVSVQWHSSQISFYYNIGVVLNFKILWKSTLIFTAQELSIFEKSRDEMKKIFTIKDDQVAKMSLFHCYILNSGSKLPQPRSALDVFLSSGFQIEHFHPKSRLATPR